MGDFSNGLCSCCEDIGACAVTYFCPCYTAGKNAEAVGDSCCLWGCLSLTPLRICTLTMTRGKVRVKYGIDVSKLNLSMTEKPKLGLANSCGKNLHGRN